MAPVTVSLVLLILCCAGALADTNGKPPKEKSWKCPVVNTFARCDSYIRHCLHDYGCPGNQKCCDGGCIMQCTPRP
ncbi:WAP four-disulfide core domain protein 18-like [Bufo gargarizans]|uniref:WAP four-disulfide core domain protein 18-like n=1 Tax=Bufo gargarizans TaxID=30331 RepID=UPI001CF3D7DB|nr:WAP four-disulfide core domain protein 18-like [Bufo gargarizans]